MTSLSDQFKLNQVLLTLIFSYRRNAVFWGKMINLGVNRGISAYTVRVIETLGALMHINKILVCPKVNKITRKFFLR